MELTKIQLALDFDGVIADSINECLVVAQNAFGDFIGKKSIIYSQEKIKNEAEKRRLRNFIRSGEDYVFIQLALQENAQIQNQKDFDEFCEKHGHLRQQFFNIFYGEREWLSANHFSDWINLNPTYSGIAGFLKAYPFKDQLYIISTKKIEFIQKILKADEINLIYENMFHASSKHSKREIILDLLRQTGVPPKYFYFVDDQIDTLIKVKDTGINCLFAEWGYNNDEQKGKADAEGIKAINLTEFFEMFKNG